MFSLGQGKQIEDFAIGLAREFAQRCPPEQRREDARAATAMAKVIDDVANRAAAYQREHKLWVYGKVKLATSFKLELKELGYPEEFVDSLTRQLLLLMSGR